MAIKLINREHSNFVNGTVDEYLCDTDEDFASLPVAKTGSVALSVKTGNIKVVDTTGAWVDFAKEE